jgi:hypothetical protein
MRRVCAAVREQAPQLRVELAFLEFMPAGFARLCRITRSPMVRTHPRAADVHRARRASEARCAASARRTAATSTRMPILNWRLLSARPSGCAGDGQACAGARRRFRVRYAVIANRAPPVPVRRERQGLRTRPCLTSPSRRSAIWRRRFGTASAFLGSRGWLRMHAASYACCDPMIGRRRCVGWKLFACLAQFCLSPDHGRMEPDGSPAASGRQSASRRIRQSQPFSPEPAGAVAGRTAGRGYLCRRLLTFGGVDLLDGTPVLDIKPYLPFVESEPAARGGFVAGPPPQLRSISVLSRAAAVPACVPLARPGGAASRGAGTGSASGLCQRSVAALWFSSP